MLSPGIILKKTKIETETLLKENLQKYEIWEIVDLKNYQKKEFAKKIEVSKNINKKENFSLYIFKLALLSLKMNDQKYIQIFKDLQDEIMKNTKEQYEMITNDINNKAIDQKKVLSFFQTNFTLNYFQQIIERNDTQNFNNILHFFQTYRQIIQKYSKELSKEDQESLEILFLGISIKHLKMKISSLKIFNDLTPNVFQSLKLNEIYQKLLSIDLNNQESLITKNILNSNIIYEICSIILQCNNRKIFEDFISILWEICTFENFSYKLNSFLFKEIIKYSENCSEFSNKFTMFSISLIKLFSKQIKNLKQHEFVFVLFSACKNNSSKHNYEVISNFWKCVIDCFVFKYYLFSAYSQKMILYSIGKEAYISDEISENVFKMELKNMKKSKEIILHQPILLKKYSNLFKAGVNLKVYNLEDIHEYMENIYIFFEKDINEIKNFVHQLAPFAIRYKYFDNKFWEIYFESLEKTIEGVNSHFHIYFVLKVFHFMFNGTFKFLCEGNNQQQHEKIYKLYQEALTKPKVYEILKKNILHYFFNEIGKEKSIESRYTLLEENILACAQALGSPLIPQKTFEFMIVDFYLPVENIVIEVMGPTHFIKNKENQSQMTTLTEFKINCLKAMNFKVITINPDEETKKGSSIEKAFLQQYEQLVNF